MTEHKILEHRLTLPTTNALAVIALVISLLGVITTFLIPILPQIAAIICGHIARYQVKHSGGSQTGSGMALAALIISYLSVFFGLIAFVFLSVGVILGFASLLSIDFLQEFAKLMKAI